jgi:ribosomal-protein-alanine N-acetyltransferase
MTEIRPMLVDDIPQVHKIEKSIFSMPWSKKSFEDSIKNKNTIYLVALINQCIVGYCGIYLCGEQADISNVAVDKEYRRKHVAEQLLESILEEAMNRGVRDVILEVRESNVPAISLYESLGFTEEGIRKNYYKSPTENALIMWKQNL